MTKKKKSNWIKTVKTISVDSPPGTMTKEPEEVARILLKHNKFPGAPGSINRYISFYINRGGKGISEERKDKLRKAMEIVRQKGKK